MLAALEAEIGRIGAGREALVRELASKVHQVSPDQEAIAAGSPRAATVATAVDAEPTRESYFRDNRLAAFVDSILAPSQPRAPLRALRWGAALAGAAAVMAAAVFALRGERAGDAGSAPAPASGFVAPEPPLSSAPPAAPQGAPATIVPPTPPAEASPVAVAPAQRPARRAARTPSPSPSPSGQLRILCTPWCVPYVDGKPVGQDGRSFVVPVAPEGTRWRRVASTIGSSNSSTSRRGRMNRRTSISTTPPADRKSGPRSPSPTAQISYSAQRSYTRSVRQGRESQVRVTIVKRRGHGMVTATRARQCVPLQSLVVSA